MNTHWTDFLPLAETITRSYRRECPAGYDPKNVGAAVIAGVIAVGATAYAASEQAGAAEDANAANAANTQNTNQLNYEMFRQGRGSGGSAILPLYATDASGNPIEPQMFQDAYRTYMNTADSVSPQALANMQAIIDRTAPAQAGANQSVNDLFSGQRANEMVGNQQPMYQARTDLARSTKNAKLEALKQTLNSIKASQAKKGFTGDGSGSRQMSFEARRDANASGAIDMGQANLLNRTDEATLRNQNVDAKLQNLSLPYAIAQQGLNLSNLPSRTLIDNQNARLGGLNFFNIGTNQFQNQPLPQVQPVASTGQIVGQAIAAGANTGLQMYGQQQNLNQQQAFNQQYLNALTGNSGGYGGTPVIYRSPMAAIQGR